MGAKRLKCWPERVRLKYSEDRLWNEMTVRPKKNMHAVDFNDETFDSDPCSSILALKATVWMYNADKTNYSTTRKNSL